jgi:radical SAM superfamily enzyme YgiQ (UPF0313 family)
MPSRILLVNANRTCQPYPVFPLGMAYINAVLLQHGHATHWHDPLAGDPPLAKVIADFRPDVVGVSLRNVDDVVSSRAETYYGVLVEICAEIRAACSATLVLGGSGFSIFPKELLALSGADYGICGEGEAAFLRLLTALETGADPRAIPGLVYRSGDELQTNPPEAMDLRACPEPAFPEGAPSFYLNTSAMLSVQTQRGCPLRCCYCVYPLIEGRRQRHFEPDTVAEQFQRLHRAGARFVFIVDSVFNVNPDHVARVCEALIRSGNTVKWACFLRPQRLDADLMGLMARAGLTHIEFGTDSFCDSVLESYDKSFRFDDILHASTLAHNAGVHYCHFLVCGGPGETEATLDTSFENSLRLPQPVILTMTGIRLYPGTPLWTAVLRESPHLRDTPLLEPFYYYAPGLSHDAVSAKLQSFAARSPHWLVGELPPNMSALSARLRAKGVVGPLWEYLPLLRKAV